ncbi:MAG: hypothetical protein ACR2FM_01545 [Candidatus Saccharimonadales bacterium]
MKPTVIAVRAIGAEFARRMVRSFLIIGTLLSLLLLSLGGWLTTMSAWWWLLQVAFIVATIMFVMLAFAALAVIRVADPLQTKSQKLAVSKYVDKLQRVSENFQTPQFIIFFRVVRDAVRPRQGGFIETVSRDSKTLAPDFAEVLKQFH